MKPTPEQVAAYEAIAAKLMALLLTGPREQRRVELRNDIGRLMVFRDSPDIDHAHRIGDIARWPDVYVRILREDEQP